jgi:hypothetical protein
MVKVSKKHLIILAVGALLCLLCGFWVGKGMYDRPVEESVSLDTVIFHDTIPDIAPEPKDSTPVRTIIRWLPMKLPKASGSTHEDGVKEVNFLQTDTVAQWQLFGSSEHPQDSALVEIPITSKHYGSKDYDAWVSGFEVSLDSIKVYKETQYITETITRMKPPNKWELDLIGGLNYNTARQDFTPYAGGEILYKPNRLQVGVRAVVSKTANTGKFEPSVGGVVKIRLF